MNLGEKIYRLRTAKNLSQGDLAELLEVSRQSVSKWETGSSSPDLDKIIKLSEIFGVSIDELVKGESLPPSTPEDPQKVPPQIKYVYVEKEQKLPPRKIAAIILLCMGFILAAGTLFAGGGLFGIVLAVPFWVACFICFSVPKHSAIWALWADYFIIDGFMRYATGANLSMIFNPVYYSGEFPGQLLISWIWAAVLAALIAATAFAFRNEHVKNPQAMKKFVIAGWCVLTAKEVVLRLLLNEKFVVDVIAGFDMAMLRLYSAVLNLISVLSIALFVFTLTNTVRLILSAVKEKRARE